MLLEPVEAGGQIYLTNDARRFSERHLDVPYNDLGLLLELAARISSGDTGAAHDLPPNRDGVIAARDTADVRDWL